MSTTKVELITPLNKNRLKYSCVVPTCYGKKFYLAHKFPMENDRTVQWLKSLDIPELNNIPYDKLRTSCFVCSRHFRKEDYKNPVSRYLNKTAVPCINLKSLDELELCNNNFNNILQNNDSSKSISIIIEKLDKNVKRSYNSIDENNENNDDYVNEVKTFKLSSENLELNDDTENFNILYNSTDNDYYNYKDDENVQQIITNNTTIDHNNSLTEVEFENENENVNEHHNKILKISRNKEGKLNINKANLLTYSKKSAKNHNKDKLIVMTSKFLKIFHQNYSETLNLDYFWLRDHCRCSLCFNYSTNQRNYSLLDISLDVKPDSSQYKNEKLLINWNDGHNSEYNLDFLFESQFEYIKKNYVLTKQILWDKKKIVTEEYARIDLGKLVTDDKSVEEILKSLIIYGFAFIENVPTNSDMTEMAIRRLFEIQKTFFGEMWTFGETQAHADTAYSKNYLEAHTDNTYFCDAAGLQIFHCLEHKNGTGGETFLVDGFKVIQDLMEEDYDAYQKLVEINVPSEYIEDGQHHTYSAPLIRLNPDTKKPEQIRFNLYDRSILNTLPQNEMHEFYKCFQYFAKLITMKENHWKFKLNPGTILIFDNWRILHGRESYTGKRKMCGSYVSRTEFLSKARQYGLIR